MIDQLDRWYVETLSDRAGLVVLAGSKFIRHCANAEFGEAQTMLADDFISVDHRLASFDSLDRAGQIERVRSLHDVAPGFEMVIAGMNRLTELGAVVRVRVTATDSTGEWDYAAVVLFTDGLFTRIEYFEFDDIDTALARFDELIADTGS